MVQYHVGRLYLGFLKAGSRVSKRGSVFNHCVPRQSRRTYFGVIEA